MSRQERPTNDPKDGLTIDDLDPSWSEWHADRLPDVHGRPAGTGHFWVDSAGRRVDGLGLPGVLEAAAARAAGDDTTDRAELHP